MEFRFLNFITNKFLDSLSCRIQLKYVGRGIPELFMVIDSRNEVN